ncbi:DUF2938 domain-containing protein [Halomonas sp. HP20-15]|uniref:DUF2938 domain-containing protein n=1 Tax=Halomonas sp. HP20-15 TaxID=3085901 RepID=UPI002980A614|nr:DUF2938 domain-containing protein [Halomonas sp. HP20-15]MDW5376231.1 DUF2938 domain-containing protein [Halomonas sp. HP20-15]
MQNLASFLHHTIAIGVGATVFMDFWALLQKRLFGIPSLDYAMVGRWLGHIPNGRLHHDDPIGAAPSVTGENLIGWMAHYASGIVLAALLLAIWGLDWVQAPTLAPPLIMGLGSIVAPFFILQPALGAGIAARRTPSPNIARARSLIAHLSFSIGLFIAAQAWSWMLGV